jgi:hypothetical protein
LLVKRLIRRVAPPFLLEAYWHGKQLARRMWQRRKSVEDVFTTIYAENQWGGEKGEFFSGPGTTDEDIAGAYVAMIAERAASEGFVGLRFVDLGCGDFRIGEQLVTLCSTYTGVDVVQPLVMHLRARHGSERVSFVHANIIEDALPPGDVCFVRQVFQHLSNAEILRVLPKLSGYRWVFITEHYPTSENGVLPNLDMDHGAGTRRHNLSAVYLTGPPFGLPRERYTEVLERPAKPVEGFDNGSDPGLIRTYLYKPGG